MKKHIPNFITSLNLLVGSAGCMTVLSSKPETGIYFILIAGLFDFLDGLTARLLGVKSAIGKELDSLADLVSFGLLPALVMVRLIGETTTSELTYLYYFPLIIVVFSALRLAKFNIDDSQTNEFIGLPTPANAILLATLPLLNQSVGLNVWVLLTITVISCALLVSPIKMIALKFKNLSWAENTLKYLLLITIILILVIFRADGIPFLIPAYIIISIIGNFTSNNRV